jgi:4-hydroxybenzoate polyprenyltransferase
MAERFPAKNGVMCLLAWSASLAWGRFHAVPGPIVIRPRDAAGFFAAYGYFFMLRVFDEHKDYAHDLVAHPGRVLQRGLITLGHLRVAAAVAIAAQLGASLLLDGGVGAVTLAWLATFAWSLLMAKEFFAGEWLRPRLVLYAFTHMVAMPLAIHWMVRMGSGALPLPLAAMLLPATSYAYGFAIEVGRKLKAPAEERPEVDSYTRAFGTGGAPVVLGGIVLLVTAGFAGMVVLAHPGRLPAAALAIVGGAALVALVACGRFRAEATAARAKACETAVGVVVLLDHLALLFVLLAARGIAAG